ncbi:DUF6879 family protein [Sphaerobacter thermophilus]|uniref:DUF6879 family protein n=1 Tax=Sphaerobacter thermophilus TaxID=2057 RepID=UPI0039C07AAE
MLDVQGLNEYIDTYFTRTLFRLETLDQYEVASDGSDFARYLQGEPEPDWDRKGPWLDHLRDEARRGLYRHRVHVLRGPLGDYLRYECEWGYAYNARAGEDIRILDLAETPEPTGLVDHDFWLIDDERVLRMHYDEAGQFVGAEELPRDATARYREARDAAWNHGTPFESYWAEHPQYWRGSAHAA